MIPFRRNWCAQGNTDIDCMGPTMKKITVQKSYNRSGKLGILDLLGIRKINNLRVINTPVESDPDQVHQ